MVMMYVVVGLLLCVGVVAVAPAFFHCFYDARYAAAGWIAQLLALSVWVAVLNANLLYLGNYGTPQVRITDLDIFLVLIPFRFRLRCLVIAAQRLPGLTSECSLKVCFDGSILRCGTRLNCLWWRRFLAFIATAANMRRNHRRARRPPDADETSALPAFTGLMHPKSTFWAEVE